MFPFGAHEGLGLNPALHPALTIVLSFFHALFFFFSLF